MFRIRNIKVLKPRCTIKIIKEKFTPNEYSDGISACTLETSLLCPLGKKKMKLPCRARHCKHLQCFEASSFIKMNENKITDEWLCPLCGRLAPFQDLYIDRFLKDIISKVPKDSDKVQFNEDGFWRPLSINNTPKFKSEVSLKKMSKKRPIDEVILDDMPYESKTFHDISLLTEVEKRHTEENSANTFQSKTSLAESNASIGSKPIENEAYSSHLLVSSASHSSLKIPVIDLEPTTSIKTSTIPVASAQESSPNDSSSDFKSNTSLAKSNASIGSPTISTKTSRIPVASAQERGPNDSSSDCKSNTLAESNASIGSPTISTKTSTKPIVSAQESGPNDSSSDFKSNTSLAESNASIGSPIISTKTSTIPVASAQASGPVYRLDFASYLEYLEMTNQTYIPSNRYLEIWNSGASYQTLNHNINSSAISNSTPVASVKAPSQNSKHVIDVDSDVEIID